MSEKRNRFMAELRALLGRYHVVLVSGEEGYEREDNLDVFAVFMDDRVDEEDAYKGHEVYGEEGDFFPYEQPEWEKIPNTNEIGSFFHCGLCLEEWKKSYQGIVSPKEYARQQAGWTRQGLQLWCNRHEVNIIHIDFGGHRMRANTSRKPELEDLGRVGEEE